MTESFPSWENSPVNSHVRAKPHPSHQLKNNTLGFGKNVILGALCSLCFWPFKVALVLGFQRTSPQWRNFSATNSRSGGLKNIRVRLSPIRLGNAASIRGSPKGLQNPRGPCEQSYRQAKGIYSPTVTSDFKIANSTYKSKSTDRLPWIQTHEYFMTDFTLMGNPRGKSFSLFHAKPLPTGFREVLWSLGIFLQVF